MAEVSRTARVIQNAKVALFFYCINLVLQFFSRKIFLDYLGAELLGLNTTAQNLLQFLNLAESGIGAAVAFALYKPLRQGNRQEIIDIVSLQGWFYRWVGLFVIAGSIVMMAFFPWIFAKANVPLIYAYGTFITFLISVLLSYFVNYKTIVLSADQKEYQITFRIQSIKVIKVFVQMVAIGTLSHGYLWWMGLEAVAAIITTFFLIHCVNKEYPWLSSNVSRGSELKNEYEFILIKTKQLFCHKVGGYVLTQTTPLLIYSFSSLSMVAVYGNYLIIMTGCQMLVEAVFRGIQASVGNLVSEGNKNLIKEIFWQISTLRLYIAGFIVVGVYYLSEPFVVLWIGQDYVMPPLPVLILLAIYFIQMSRTADIFLAAYGLFKDVWAPILESILNIVFSIFLGYLWGITGIFLGVLISQIIVVNSWKAIFLYHEGFKEEISEYIFLYTKKIGILVMIFCITNYVVAYLDLTNIQNSLCFIKSTIAVSLIYLTVASCLFYVLDRSFKTFILKCCQIIRFKFKS